MSLLPPRPYKIRAIFTIKYLLGSGIFAIGALALAIYSVQWLWNDEIGGIERDKHLWNTGLIASGGSVSGQERSNQFILYSYDLKVDYFDVFGKSHRGECSFSMLWTSLDTSIPTAIRYNKDNPDEFVLSWEVDHLGARWGAVILLGVGVLMIIGTLGLLAFGLTRKLRDVRRVAQQSDEILVEVISRKDQIANGTRTGAVIYLCRRPDKEAKKAEFECIMAKGEAPLCSDEAGTHLMALVAPNEAKSLWIMRRDFYPFDFTTEEIVNMRERIQSKTASRA